MQLAGIKLKAGGRSMTEHVNWVKLEEVGEVRILDALRLALNGRTITDIERETGFPLPPSVRLSATDHTHIGTKVRTQANSDDR